MSSYNGPGREPPYQLPPQCAICGRDILFGDARGELWAGKVAYPTHYRCSAAAARNAQVRD